MRAVAALQSRSSAPCSFISPACSSFGTFPRAFHARHLACESSREAIASRHRHLSSTKPKKQQASALCIIVEAPQTARRLSAFIGLAILLLASLQFEFSRFARYNLNSPWQESSCKVQSAEDCVKPELFCEKKVGSR